MESTQGQVLIPTINTHSTGVAEKNSDGSELERKQNLQKIQQPLISVQTLAIPT